MVAVHVRHVTRILINQLIDFCPPTSPRQLLLLSTLFFCSSRWYSWHKLIECWQKCSGSVKEEEDHGIGNGLDISCPRIGNDWIPFNVMCSWLMWRSIRWMGGRRTTCNLQCKASHAWSEKEERPIKSAFYVRLFYRAGMHHHHHLNAVRLKAQVEE